MNTLSAANKIFIAFVNMNIYEVKLLKKKNKKWQTKSGDKGICVEKHLFDLFRDSKTGFDLIIITPRVTSTLNNERG